MRCRYSVVQAVENALECQLLESTIHIACVIATRF